MKGKIKQTGPHQEQTNAKKTEKMKQSAPFKGKNRAAQEIKVEKKDGGRVERKRGGKVGGEKPKANLGRRARGGAAKSPLSGADAPNLPYAHGNLGVDQGGKGKTIK